MVRESNMRAPSSGEVDMDGQGRPAPVDAAGESEFRALLGEVLRGPKAPDGLREKIRRLLEAEVRRTGDSVDTASELDALVFGSDSTAVNDRPLQGGAVRRG